MKRSFPLLLYFTLFCRSSNKLSRTKAKTIFPITTTGPNFRLSCTSNVLFWKKGNISGGGSCQLIRRALKKLLQILAALSRLCSGGRAENSLIIFFFKHTTTIIFFLGKISSNTPPPLPSLPALVGKNRLYIGFLQTHHHHSSQTSLRALLDVFKQL